MTAGCLQERDYKGTDSDTKPGHLIVEAWSPEFADPITAHEARTYTHEGKNNFRTRNVVSGIKEDRGVSSMQVRRLTPL